jgi:hypothetical protein
MRRALMIIAVVALAILAGGAAWWHYRPQPPQFEHAVVGQGRVTLWSSTAEVRENLATLHYGDSVEILAKYGDAVKARTSAGVVGWLEDRELLFKDVWGHANELIVRARSMPVQARGHTKALSNLRLDPGRNGVRVVQLGRDARVEMLERRVEDVPGAPAKDGAAGARKREEWWLVRAQVPELGEAAGWLLGRFVQLDAPAPLPDYATAAAMRIVAWYELNHVMDPEGGAHPQYLVAGVAGGENLDCDFTVLRVFTWGNQRQRYETAYVESNLCGRLPIRVNAAGAPGGDSSFHFVVVDGARGSEELTYNMRQTIVRRAGAVERHAGRKRR